ncbi:MAG: hypothetical protein L0H83_04975, partial [Salinisphaera sp.]|nr:hypothetical protein [Salinisphaera sp.]
WTIGDVKITSIYEQALHARPEFSTLIDSLPDVGVATRRGLLDRVAADGTLVIGSHFSAPSGGTISRYGESFRLNAG